MDKKDFIFARTVVRRFLPWQWWWVQCWREHLRRQGSTFSAMVFGWKSTVVWDHWRPWSARTLREQLLTDTSMGKFMCMIKKEYVRMVTKFYHDSPWNDSFLHGPKPMWKDLKLTGGQIGICWGWLLKGSGCKCDSFNWIFSHLHCAFIFSSMALEPATSWWKKNEVFLMITIYFLIHNTFFPIANFNYIWVIF